MILPEQVVLSSREWHRVWTDENRGVPIGVVIQVGLLQLRSRLFRKSLIERTHPNQAKEIDGGNGQLATRVRWNSSQEC